MPECRIQLYFVHLCISEFQIVIPPKPLATILFPDRILFPKLVSCPDPPPHVWEERGAGVLGDFSCHSSPIWELESDCITFNYMRWRRNRTQDPVCMQGMGIQQLRHSTSPHVTRKAFRTPDPLSAFRGWGLGTRVDANSWSGYAAVCLVPSLNLRF